ncbi:MAG: O-antigen ligase family protein [bacterium]|nr:O-antigen ligase family protein [bacterium]
MMPKLAIGVLAVLLFWVPLPFGSVVDWAHVVLRICTVGLLCLVAFTGPRGAIRAVGVLIAAMLFISVLGWIQAARFPSAIVGAVSPAHLEIAAKAAEETVPVTGARLSLTPYRSREVGLSWLAVAACLMVAAMAVRVRQRRVLLFTLVGAALFQVLYGARHWMANMTEIWGVSAPSDVNRLRGTFVNSDHFALYAELALVVVFAWVWIALRRDRANLPPERRLLAIAPPVLVWLTLIAAIAFTGSRAGIAAAAVATVVQGLLLAARQQRVGLATAGVSAVLLGVLFISVLGVQAGFGRWMATSRSELTWNGRMEIYAASLELSKEFPVLGTGLGSFREAFAMVQPAKLQATVGHAHNDYLEMLVTTGVVGGLVLLIGAGFTARRLGRLLMTTERSEDAAAVLAALGACVAVGLHSFVDFGLTMPANSVTFVVIVGAALAVGAKSEEKAV